MHIDWLNLVCQIKWSRIEHGRHLMNYSWEFQTIHWELKISAETNSSMESQNVDTSLKVHIPPLAFPTTCTCTPKWYWQRKTILNFRVFKMAVPREGTNSGSSFVKNSYFHFISFIYMFNNSLIYEIHSCSYCLILSFR